MPKRTRKAEDEVELPKAEDLSSVPSYTPPNRPNDAADTSLPHEDERPETRAESRERRRGETTAS